MRIFAALMVGVLVSGCAFGTNHVKLPPVPTVGAPEGATTLHVSVKDARSDLSGAQVGFKRNGYGAKTGSVELANGEQVASRVEQDLVSILRARGYNAVSVDAHAGDGLACSAEVVSFVIDVKEGFWSGSLEGLTAVRIEITDERSGRSVWHDVVRGSYTKSGLQFISEEDHQEVAERTYDSLVTNLKAAIPDGRAPLVKPVALGR